MVQKNLFRVLISSALVAVIIPVGLIVFLLNYHPDASPAATDKVDSGTPDNSAEGAQDLEPDKDTAPDGSAPRSEDPSNPNDGGPVKKTQSDGPRYVIKNPGDDPKIHERASDQEFDRLMAASRVDLWNSALERANDDVPADDRYCWNMSTAVSASFSLAREELHDLIDSNRFVGFPMSCSPRPQNH